MSATQAHEMPASPAQQHDGDLAADRRGASPWLWMALIIAMFAAALVWLRYSGGNEIAPAPVGERTLPATADTRAAPPAARQAVTDRPATPRAAPVVRNREASPLAGNSKPTYPARALRSGVQGSVVASLNVDTRGNVSEAAIVSRTGNRDRDLDREVLRTLQGWKFEPAMQDGRAVASVVRVPVDFRVER